MKKRLLFALLVCICWTGVRGQISDFCGTDFSKADSIAELNAAHSLKDLKGLAEKLTGSFTTDQEKFRAIYKWVCSNIEVDYSLVITHKQKSNRLQGEELVQWKKQFNRIVFQILLDEQRTLCTGYAYLIRELAFHSGIQCRIVNGHAKPGGILAGSSETVNHSWNVVRLNNKWYPCDATWSSGFFDRTSGRFQKKFNDKYFLAEPASFAREHASPCESMNE